MPLPPRRILIIDDDKLLAKLLSDVLSVMDREADAIFDPTQAIEQLKKHEYDLIFLDIHMPDKNGIQLLQELKANPKTKDVPVILLTNDGSMEMIQTGKELGAEDYLIKLNINTQMIKKIMRKHLKGDRWFKR